MTPPLLLDGATLARLRAPDLAARAGAVTRLRGSPPRLLVLAFAPPGADAPPHLEKKLRACRSAGIQVEAVEPSTTQAVAALEAGVERLRPDAVFLQFPFPPGVDGEALVARIPPEADIDALGPAAPAGRPPLTAAGLLALLDHHGVRLEGRGGVLVGAPGRYHDRFREALARRGTRMAPLVAPDDPYLREKVGAAELVVLSAGRPGLVPASWLASGAVAVDAGYFNPDGRGDLDTSPGTDHLAALAPVPGGVGPMTVSALVEAVVAAAEGTEGRR